MMFSLNIILCLAFQLFLGVNNSMVTLNNNGYDGIVIAINPSVPEDNRLIQSIKEMVREASPYLFRATKQRVYFRSVSILIPVTWKSKPEYMMAKQESYEQADVIVAAPDLNYGDDPYTLQYGQCGQKGKYIHFTPNFLLSDNLLLYGPRGRAFVHEWAHLRWGVFDEYNNDQPFYMSRKKTIEATRCPTDINGTYIVNECSSGNCKTRTCRHDPKTGLYEENCMFFPQENKTAKESIMFMQNINSVVDFCTSKTHNTEAPNLQNKMCNKRSTWEVIMESSDFQNLSPMKRMDPPAPPTFSLLKSKQRVVCLVLDNSESMNTDDRLIRMKQAAELFLIQILEKGSFAGLVTFSDTAKIQTYLTKISDDNSYKKILKKLPKKASGGLAICEGLKSGFQAITKSNQSTFGSEIILLTNGEDPKISLCFEEVKQSGAIIHTIALGPSATNELETLSKMTGGYHFYANKDPTGLIDAFSRISSRSGSLSQQAIELESKSFNTSGNTWVYGRVPIDSTIGSDTYFVVIWKKTKPEIYLQNPKGKIYNTSDFKEDKIHIRSARLYIPGIAETGFWIYRLKNKDINHQLLTVIVTTRASSPTKLPVTITAHMSENTAQYPSPMIVYAQVSQGFLPVLGFDVTATIENETGHQVTLELWDNGVGADTVKNDGIYSRYFTDYSGNGRYSLKVRAQSRKSGAYINLRHHQNRARYIPGYTVNGTVVANPPRPVFKDVVKPSGESSIVRTVLGGAFVVEGNSCPEATPLTPFPPSKINDLHGKFEKNIIHLTWTAPGNNLDKGKSKHYDLRTSNSYQQLQDDFNNAHPVNTSSLIPRMAGLTENFEFIPTMYNLENGTQVYIAIKAISEENLTSEVSNIVVVTYIVPSLGTNIFAVRMAFWGLAVIVSVKFNKKITDDLKSVIYVAKDNTKRKTSRSATRPDRRGPDGGAVPEITFIKAPPRSRRSLATLGTRAAKQEQPSPACKPVPTQTLAAGLRTPEAPRLGRSRRRRAQLAL
ncbi:PREDICTED: epithelial chloride channel protein-like [Elephantulus edwardii]|uniref:epithelial chloride channel protein-like n=1 Tax=Elephantulus edwardii TaxID=28737 RepID=UPI0003F0DD96|nr:PREDICTED: epithelial chloride channel protein-like [Elephantulus edwardii]